MIQQQPLTQPPAIGDEFVWMEASPSWDEFVYQIADVIELVGEGCWLIEYGEPSTPINRAPAVLVQKFGESVCDASLHQTVVEFRDGRWRRPKSGATP